MFSGRCAYADRYAELLGRGYVFAPCDTVEIERNATGRSTIHFRGASLGPDYLFSGGMAGDAMDVSELSIRAQEAVPVTGQCKLFRRDGIVSVVTCVVRDKRTTFVANFERTGPL